MVGRTSHAFAHGHPNGTRPHAPAAGSGVAGQYRPARQAVPHSSEENHEGPVNPGLAATERVLYTYRSVSLTGRDTPPELPDLTQRTTPSVGVAP